MPTFNKSKNRAEVLVIGAGASGSIASRYLAESGFKVICLEQGDFVHQNEYYTNSSGWEVMQQSRWHPNPNIRGLASDYPINTDFTDVNPLMYNAVGGSTIIYAAHWHRFTPSDFCTKSLDGVGEDWPIKYKDLAPFYDHLDIDMGVSGLAGDPAFPPGSPPPLPPLPIGKVGRKAAEGMNKLGWHWWPGSQAIPSSFYRGRSKCTRRGMCMSGCPEEAKATMDKTHWPDALKFGAQIITGARVRKITCDAKGLASGAIYIDRKGIEHHQSAEIVLVCCNGIGTPRLLLNSTSRKFPDGLANSSGMVGRNLMMHPFAAVVGYFDDNLDSWQGPNGLNIYSMEFYETDQNRGFVRGARWSAQGTGGPLGLRSSMDGRPIDDVWGKAFHQNTRKRLGKSIEWGIVAEDLPEYENKVDLDPNLKDSDGIPAPRIKYRNSENTKKLISFHVARAKEALQASGAYELSSTELMTDSGWHLLGTCRMGNDPQKSVVDSWCRSHDVPNLFIVDGSTFVTSSGVNPTATIGAISLRTALFIIENRSQIECSM